jgi:endonuclease/exonuclease/phosphatase family metal-dependent hydrolase
LKNLKLIQILYLNLIIMLFSCEKQPEQPIRAMTFNIRLNVASDSLNAWPYRKDMAASMIQFYHTDIVGIQEALFDQVNDLAARLPDYGWFGVGRDDGKQQGEFMAIFYLKQRFTVLHHATFWLSETPEVPGLGWDAACNRIVTWGKFEDQLTGKIFYHFNTHFDHRGEIARQESARLLLNSIRQIAGNAAVIITGDFNSTPNSIPYQILTQKFEGKTGFKLIDTKEV